jgi:hypothetical protein
MYGYDIKNTKDFPEFKPLFRAMGYRKQRFILKIVEVGEKETGPAWWDGGSRTQYFLADRRANVSPAPCISNPFEFKREVGYPTVMIDDNSAMIEDGTFCGKPATMVIRATQGWVENQGA